jgi:hypothetical protein
LAKFPHLATNQVVSKIINHMSVILKRGKTKMIDFPMTPSTALTADTFVKLSSGKIVACVAGDAALDIVGVNRKTIAATDADYASDRMIQIEVPVERHVEYTIDVGTGTIAATDLNTEYDLAAAGTIDQSATTDKVAKLIKFVSSTKGVFWVKFNGGGY